jgi:hypothetical protein
MTRFNTEAALSYVAAVAIAVVSTGMLFATTAIPAVGIVA